MGYYKIIVKGDAKTDYPLVEELNGKDCQDNFAEYFDRKHTFKKNIKSGYMHFSIEDGVLMTVTEYTSDRELTDKELDSLLDYTKGQWSDGIGEGFEQRECHEGTVAFNIYDPEYDDYEDQEEADEDRRVFISAWHGKQVSTIEQKLIN